MLQMHAIFVYVQNIYIYIYIYAESICDEYTFAHCFAVHTYGTAYAPSAVEQPPVPSSHPYGVPQEKPKKGSITIQPKKGQ